MSLSARRVPRAVLAQAPDRSTPVPVSGTAFGEPAPLLAIDTVALRGPRALGVKRTPTLHDPPTGRIAPVHEFELIVNSAAFAPPTVTPPTRSR